MYPTRSAFSLCARAVWAALVLLQVVSANAISCFSDLAIVRDVSMEHMIAEARSVVQRLAADDAPLDAWELEALEKAYRSPNPRVTVAAIQQILDAHVLIAISISAEAEVKATPGPVLPFLASGGRNHFLIKIDNIAGVTSTPVVESAELITATAQPSRDRWLRMQLWPTTGLSGERVDYLIAKFESAEKGKREAQFSFASGARPTQARGPLSLNRVPILFTLMPESEIAKSKLAHLLRHQHGQAYLAAQRRRGPPLMAVRADACLECHATAPDPAANPVQLAREQSCLACHRELGVTATSGTGGDLPCSICGMRNCRMGCIAIGKTQSGHEVMLMAGLPRWLFLGSVGIVLIVSFLAAEILNRRRRTTRSAPSRRLNLLSVPILAWCSRQSWLKPAVQVPCFALFCFLVYAGLVGDSVVNITPIITWTIWWAGLIFVVLFVGKAWCFVCPWDFAATLVQRAPKLWGSNKLFTFRYAWPRAARNIALAIGLFIALTWLELGFHVTSSPRATAVLALVMVALAVMPALLFDRRAFCRYGCLIGRISGLYAMFAPVEVRARDISVCKDCKTHDCYRGNERAPGCPTSLFVPTLKANTYCIQCGFCARSCPNANVAVNARGFAADLADVDRPRWDESLLAIILLALTSFHGLTMTPFWDGASGFSVIGWIRSHLGADPLTAFTIGMAAILIVPIAFFWLLCAGTSRLAGDPSVKPATLFLHFAYTLLPVALFYHLAHNAMHFFMEAQWVVPLLSDPLGRGWDLFGTAGMRLGPMLSADSVWLLQAGLVVTGHVAGIVIAHRAAHRLYPEPRRAMLALLPMLAGMVLYSWFSLWILHLDMNMRSTLM